MPDLVISAQQQRRLHSAIYKTLERHGADMEVLSVFGSMFDTLELDEVLDLAEDWLASGATLSTSQ